MTAKTAARRTGKAATARPSADFSTAPAGEGAPAPGKVVGAVDGAIRILRHLAKQHQPAGVSKIAKETNLNTSTAFNILRTLALHDLVLFDAHNKTYALSLGIMEIARGATALGSGIEMTRPAMERIAQAHGVTVTLWQPVSRTRKVLVMSAHNRNAMRIQMAVGQRLPMFTGATGRIFAAFDGYKEAELKARFEEVRWDQPLTFKEFRDQVSSAREKGYAIDDGNFASGTVSLAVPIFGRDGTSGMSVTVTMFTGQYSVEKGQEIIRELLEFAKEAQRYVS